MNHEDITILHLDAIGRLLGVTSTQGGRHHVSIPLGSIVSDAAQFGTAVLVLSHTHYDGDPTPSRDDIVATRGILKIAAALNIRVHDHIVTAGQQKFSFRDAGLL